MHTGFKYCHTTGSQMLQCVMGEGAESHNVRRFCEDLKDDREQIVS